MPTPPAAGSNVVLRSAPIKSVYELSMHAPGAPPSVAFTTAANASMGTAPGAVMVAQMEPTVGPPPSALYCTTPITCPATLLASHITSLAVSAGAQLDILVLIAVLDASSPRMAVSSAANAAVTAARHAGDPPTAGSDSDADTTSLYPVKSAMASTGADVANAPSMRCGSRRRAHAASAPGYDPPNTTVLEALG